jgi:hypothetical protein
VSGHAVETLGAGILPNPVGMRLAWYRTIVRSIGLSKWGGLPLVLEGYGMIQSVTTAAAIRDSASFAMLL